jgi:hypothetical protein
MKFVGPSLLAFGMIADASQAANQLQPHHTIVAEETPSARAFWDEYGSGRFMTYRVSPSSGIQGSGQIIDLTTGQTLLSGSLAYAIGSDDDRRFSLDSGGLASDSDARFATVSPRQNPYTSEVFFLGGSQPRKIDPAHGYPTQETGAFFAAPHQPRPGVDPQAECDWQTQDQFVTPLVDGQTDSVVLYLAGCGSTKISYPRPDRMLVEMTPSPASMVTTVHLLALNPAAAPRLLASARNSFVAPWNRTDSTNTADQFTGLDANPERLAYMVLQDVRPEYLSSFGVNGGKLIIRVLRLADGLISPEIDASKVVSLPADADKNVMGLVVNSYRLLDDHTIDFHLSFGPRVQGQYPDHWSGSVSMLYDLTRRQWVGTVKALTPDRVANDSYDTLESDSNEHFHRWASSPDLVAFWKGTGLRVSSEGTSQDYRFENRILRSVLSATGKLAVVCSEDEVKVFDLATGALALELDIPLFQPSQSVLAKMMAPRDLTYCRSIQFTERDRQIVLEPTEWVEDRYGEQPGSNGTQQTALRISAPSLVIDLTSKEILLTPQDGWDVVPLVGEKALLRNVSANLLRVQDLSTGEIVLESPLSSAKRVSHYYESRSRTGGAVNWLGIVPASQPATMRVYQITR